MAEAYPWSIGFDWQKCKPYDEKAQQYLLDTHALDNRTIIEEKLDGWRTLLTRDPDGVLHLYSRGVSVETGERIDLLSKYGDVPDATSLTITKGDAVEGELVWPGHRAAEVPTALKDDNTRRELLFVAFGHPYDAGKRVTTAWQQSELLEFLECRRPLRLGFGAHMFTPAQLNAYAAARSVEGWIVKEYDAEDGRWWKCKREHTIDVVVVDTKPGKGKYEGLIGAFIVGVVSPIGEWSLGLDDGTTIKVRELASVSGMDDSERHASPDSVIGRVCEIECQSVGAIADGRLRHPRFIRWREDKPAVECRGEELRPTPSCGVPEGGE